MLDHLRREVCEANRLLETSGLVQLTFGNVSGIDRALGIFGIKPSGVPYKDLRPDHIVLLDLQGKVVEGELNPSSDTKTHLALYRAFTEIGGITHTHSPYATAFAQAGREIPCLGTTHADHFRGAVPLCRALFPHEVMEDYEANTGKAIVERFQGVDPMSMPAVLQLHHGPFTWGRGPVESVKYSIALELCAQIALATLSLAPGIGEIPPHIQEKHFQRKHGAEAYYGQKPVR